MRRLVAFVLVALIGCGESTPPGGPISITDINPTSGPQAGGTTVTITGTNFPATSDIASVHFGIVPAASFTVQSSTEATVVTPAHTTAGLVGVTVTLKSGAEATLPNAFTFIPPSVPAVTITSVSPTSGPQTGGTTVTLTGTNFPAAGEIASINFGTVAAASFSVASGTQATAVTPSHGPGTVAITMTLKSGATATLPNAFAFTATPAETPIVTSLSRDVGSTAGGAVLRVNGSKFTSGTVVSFGGVNATTTLISASVLEAVVPARAAGPGQVAVTVTQGGLTSSSVNFEYLPAPTTTFASSDFETGALAPFTSEIFGAGETVTVSTERAFSGTRAVRCASPIAGHQAEMNFTLTDNRMLLETNGVYVRFYIYVPDATVNAAQGGQIKLQLVRSKNTAPAWLMVGVGTQFSGAHSRALVTMIDNGTVHIPGTFWSASNLGDATGWVEVQYWYTRKNGTGRSRVWYNGKLFADVTDSRLGGDLSTSAQSVRLGIVYQQDMVGASVVFLDKVAIANGFIDP